MYKYKKTIIINNRNRKIYSKEKSKKEYILYKNNYITLNAYNKQKGGVNNNIVQILRRKIFGEKNSFEIPYYIYNNIFGEKYKICDIYNYKNIYNNNFSDLISLYLKKKGSIPDSNNKKWIITDFSYNGPITVLGFSDDEYDIYINKMNSEEDIIKYGTSSSYEKYLNINYPQELTYLLYNKLVNSDGRIVYDKLKTENIYFIYYIIQLSGENKVYKKDNIYDLFDTKFKCVNIKNTSESYGDSEIYRYTIIFEYIGDNKIDGGGKIKNNRCRKIKNIFNS